MKIVRNTPEQLILRSAPWIIGVVIIVAILGVTAAAISAFSDGNIGRGFLLIGVGPGFLGLFFCIFVRRDDLILDRSRKSLELRHTTVLGRKTIKHELQHLDEAVVQTSRSGDNGPTHRVALILNGGMDQGTHPVTEVYTSGRGAERAAAEINTWLGKA